MSDTERYWGGYTEHGRLLHLAVGSTGWQYARSACGLVLTGGASEMPAHMLVDAATCKRCDAASRAVSGGQEGTSGWGGARRSPACPGRVRW